MILAGDIGGTNTRLALLARDGARPAAATLRSYPSRTYRGLADVIEEFLTTMKGRPRRACFGVAGPVTDGRCHTTNLPWLVDARRLGRHFGFRVTLLLNDLEAIAWGIPGLGPRDVEVLQAGRRRASGNLAVIAAGTGLGEAGLYWDGRHHRPFACEGGHADFAARSEREAALRRHLGERFGHVSCERVLSGPGLHNVYAFLRDSGAAEEPAWLAAELAGADPSAAIARAALEGRSEPCAEALDLFVSVYGAEAGNLALKLMATGGVYLAGGIAPKILPRLRGGAFVEAFVAKGRMQALLEAVPVRVVTYEHVALLGAARCATRASAR
jgi:glucokinase